MSEPTVDSATAAPTDCGLSYAFARRSALMYTQVLVGVKIRTTAIHTDLQIAIMHQPRVTVLQLIELAYKNFFHLVYILLRISSSLSVQPSAVQHGGRDQDRYAHRSGKVVRRERIPPRD